MAEPMDVVTCDVAVIGGGPAGLTAATELRRAGVPNVVVLEREEQAGGIPRHSDHTGYGLRDRRAVLTGPAYARALVADAHESGVDVRTGSMVTGWAEDGSPLVTSPVGRARVAAGAIVLATGARERPRAARMIPGDRPAGVYTTGQLQGLVHLRHRSVGSRAVVVGSELVSWSAVLTLREAGCSTDLMATQASRVETPAGLALAGRTVFGFPIARRTRLARIIGRDRVEGVELEHLDTGARTRVPCDTVILTGDWVPDNELTRLRGLELGDGHRGPLVDMALRTSAPGVFAAGNLLHPVDTADVAALDGRHVADAVHAWLSGERVQRPAVRLIAEEPFAWVAPGLLRPGDPPPSRGRLLLWGTEHRALPRVVVEQGGTVISRRRIPWPLAPGRMFRLPYGMVAAARAGAGDVTIRLG
ncbi:MAG: FAD-dependent oxidoreductase [Actinobacteria bacterium]|nr:FAD-dependent oxidoreductase [Actinomycetota bacterium]